MVCYQQSLSLLLLILLSSSCFGPSSGTPVNDDVCSPSELEIDTPLDWDLSIATKQPGEITPGFGSGLNDGCNADDGWCNFGEAPEEALDASLWYTIVGPASGCLTITTEYAAFNDGSGYKGGDTQLALWSVEDDSCCGFLRNFDGFVEIAANDDREDTCQYYFALQGCAAELYRIPVIPGAKYYVQLANSYYDQALHEGTITATSCDPSFTSCGTQASIIPNWMQCCDATTGVVGSACCGTRGYHPPVQKCCPSGDVVLQGFPCPGPTPSPTPCPTLSPTASPTASPTTAPTKSPSRSPTKSPTASPTTPPTRSPTASPTTPPTKSPTRSPTKSPTASPTSDNPPLQFVANGSIDEHSLGVCQGDCDEDEDCAFGLICNQRNTGDIDVPGCSGNANQVAGANSNYDYCIIPPEGTLVLMGNNNSPANAFPLGECQGDCDDDDDCEDGLECFKRSDSRSVPGCNNSGNSGSDYCIVP